jgi:hypothetical protein
MPIVPPRVVRKDKIKTRVDERICTRYQESFPGLSALLLILTKGMVLV